MQVSRERPLALFVRLENNPTKKVYSERLIFIPEWFSCPSQFLTFTLRDFNMKLRRPSLSELRVSMTHT